MRMDARRMLPSFCMAAMMLLAAITCSAADDALGFPPAGWSREQLLCEYSRLTGAFSVDISGDLLLIAYSDGQYDSLKIRGRAFSLGKDGPQERWSREVSANDSHNVFPLVMASKSGGFHVFWVERPDDTRYSIRYSRLDGSGAAVIEDTLLETGNGPIRDLTAAELPDGDLVLAWSDWRGRTLDVMAGRVELGGGPVALSGKVTYERIEPDRAMSTPRIAYIDGVDEIALLWVESGFEKANLNLAWLDPADLSSQGSVVLGTYSTASGSYPAIDTGREGEFYVSWPQDINIMSFTANKTSDIMFAHFKGREMLWSSKVVELPDNQGAPAIAFDGSQVLLSWQDFSERSPHVWVGRLDDRGVFTKGPYKADYTLLASMKPYLGSVDGRAVLVYERFTSEGPRQAYLMSQLNPAEPGILYSLGIDESNPIKHAAYSLAMSALRAAVNVMVNIAAIALGMVLLRFLSKSGMAEGMRHRPELLAGALVSFMMLLQATPLFFSLPGIFGPDFHAIVSVAAGVLAYAVMRFGRSDWWLDSLTQLVFICLWLFFQQFALLIPSLLKAGLL